MKKYIWINKICLSDKIQIYNGKSLIAIFLFLDYMFEVSRYLRKKIPEFLLYLSQSSTKTWNHINLSDVLSTKGSHSKLTPRLYRAVRGSDEKICQ